MGGRRGGGTQHKTNSTTEGGKERDAVTESAYRDRESRDGRCADLVSG